MELRAALGRRQAFDRLAEERLQALAGYERRRNEAARHDFDENLNAARFVRPPDEVYRLRVAVRGNQGAMNQLFLAREGLVPHQDAHRGDGRRAAARARCSVYRR
jgi:hypothetical protein